MQLAPPTYGVCSSAHYHSTRASSVSSSLAQSESVDTARFSVDSWNSYVKVARGRPLRYLMMRLIMASLPSLRDTHHGCRYSGRNIEIRTVEGYAMYYSRCPAKQNRLLGADRLLTLVSILIARPGRRWIHGGCRHRIAVCNFPLIFKLLYMLIVSFKLSTPP